MKLTTPGGARARAAPLARRRRRQVLAADVEWVRNDWGGNFVHGVGFDKQGRPIIYKRFGSFILSRVLSTVGLKAFMRYQVWVNEQTS